MAIDITSGKVTGKFETKYPMRGALLATPELVCLPAIHPARSMPSTQRRGGNLWEFNTNAGVNAPPMTFSVDGKQYVAILVGMGGARDKWFIASTKGLEKMAPGSMLYVFSL
jgi:alcohol dehydrogenase (cytochrome c)